MVGLRLLVPSIGVRVPVPQQKIAELFLAGEESVAFVRDEKTLSISHGVCFKPVRYERCTVHVMEEVLSS